MGTSNNNLYTSYFSTVSTDRKQSPPKKKTSTTKEPPRKLSKSFKRQIAKTLAPHSKKNKARKKAVSKRKTPKMSKRAATDSNESALKPKKTKTSNATLPEMEKDKDNQPFWEISGKRRLQLSEFKGTTMVGVREFYEKDGEALPGKKGISMTVEQFDTIVQLLPQIERELKGRGLEMRRPKYDQEAGGDMKDGEEEEEEEEEEAADEDGDAKDGSGAEEEADGE